MLSWYSVCIIIIFVKFYVKDWVLFLTAVVEALRARHLAVEKWNFSQELYYMKLRNYTHPFHSFGKPHVRLNICCVWYGVIGRYFSPSLSHVSSAKTVQWLSDSFYFLSADRRTGRITNPSAVILCLLPRNAAQRADRLWKGIISGIKIHNNGNV